MTPAAPPAPRLAALRSRWLDAVTAELRDDPSVAGAALAGSFGAGRADDWSDVDLLVVVSDAHLDGYAPPAPVEPVITIDARHNGPRGTRGLSSQYVRDGLPLWADWYVHPVSLASWPSDCDVLFDRHGIERSPLTLSEQLASGEPEPPTPKGPDEERALKLGLVPVAGKGVARRSPGTAELIAFIGGPYDPDAPWDEHLAALRRLLDDFADLGLPVSVAAGHAYLDLVADALSR
ncbi:nucleotidyltransferase domain-containing protein [Nonomuraea sp. NPDC004580]|uniref:nucleotidyltransferase domain-containing protein n=1 Tax=Nonomuraea sp. NPDC004580 TaxID=3154552 RepID=UPI00339EFCA1